MRIPDATPAKLKPIVEKWPECDEYLSKSPCKVTVNMSSSPDPATVERGQLMPHAHWDVQVKPFIKAVPRGEAAVFLVQSSPFMKCTVSAVPAAPTRDLSANIGSLLTAVAGIGAPQLERLNVEPNVNLFEENNPELQLVVPARTGVPELDGILIEIEKINAKADPLPQVISDAYKSFREAVKQNWKFTFASDDAANIAINNLKDAVKNVTTTLDYFTKLGGDLSVAEAHLANYSPKTSPDFRTVQDALLRLKTRIDLMKSHIANFGDQQKLVLQVRDYLASLEMSTLTAQALPMAYFSGKSATETITCKDAITKDQVFDNIIFTAYYEAVPHLDVSVGAIVSLLGGRQVGTLTGPFTPQQAAACAAATSAAGSAPAAPCGPTTVLGDTSKSSYQFMPAVFVEWRWKNFRCPWAENGAPSHPAGYVCSIGTAGGVAINPNNGGPAAEFFEGLSFGIQRFSILVGVHNGRYQQYGGGYYAGEVFPTGTSVMPPTAYGWATHPAFGIAYRIPIR